MMHSSIKQTEEEIRHQISVAIEKAVSEGQPVQEIYEAIKAGQDVQIRLQPSADGKVQLIISV